MNGAGAAGGGAGRSGSTEPSEGTWRGTQAGRVWTPVSAPAAGADGPDVGAGPGAGPSAGPVRAETFRPSLLAALDVPVKVALFILLFFLPLGVGGAFVANDPLVAFVPAALIAAVNFFPALVALVAPAVQILFTRYIIDEDGIRVNVTFLSKNESRVSWPKVTAITHRRTIVDRMFGIERLDVVAYGERGTTLRLVGLRDAARLRDLAARKMREHATVEALFSND